MKMFFTSVCAVLLAVVSSSCTSGNTGYNTCNVAINLGGVPMPGINVRGGGQGACASGPSCRGAGPVPMRHYHARGAQCTSQCYPLSGGGNGPGRANGYSGGYSRQPGYGGSNYPQQRYNRQPDRPIGPETIRSSDGAVFKAGYYADSMGGRSTAIYRRVD